MSTCFNIIVNVDPDTPDLTLIKEYFLAGFINNYFIYLDKSVF